MTSFDPYSLVVHVFQGVVRIHLCCPWWGVGRLPCSACPHCCPAEDCLGLHQLHQLVASLSL